MLLNVRSVRITLFALYTVFVFTIKCRTVPKKKYIKMPFQNKTSIFVSGSML
jgi:hypothetical protein